jgi:hypothetical protein
MGRRSSFVTQSSRTPSVGLPNDVILDLQRWSDHKSKITTRAERADAHLDHRIRQATSLARH